MKGLRSKHLRSSIACCFSIEDRKLASFLSSIEKPQGKDYKDPEKIIKKFPKKKKTFYNKVNH